MANGFKLTPESKRILEDFVKAGKNIDLRPVLKVVGIGYRKEVEQTFNREQPRDKALVWAPLTQKYADKKFEEYGEQPLLVRTGALKDSMIKQGAAGNITLISSNKAVFGSTISYGKFHDEGTSKMPKRNFSEPSERREKIWEGQIERHIRHDLEKAGVQVEGDIFL
jgi:phage gpG-like protein